MAGNAASSLPRDLPAPERKTALRAVSVSTTSKTINLKAVLESLKINVFCTSSLKRIIAAGMVLPAAMVVLVALWRRTYSFCPLRNVTLMLVAVMKTL